MKTFKKWKDALATPLDVERLVLRVTQLPRVRWPATKPLPPEIGTLVNLRELEIRRAGNLEGLCPELASLPKLEHFEIDNPEMTPFQFGDVLGSMPALKRLTMYNMRLTEPIALPDSLEELVIQNEPDMHLGEWLKTLQALPKLRKLSLMDVGAFSDPSFSPELPALKGLTELCLGANKLTDESAVLRELAQMTELEVLRLHANNLTTLPESVRPLERLQTLGLDHNQLTELPDWFGELAGLEELGLSVMPLRDLPPSLLNLPLNKLWIDVPDEVHAVLKAHLPKCKIVRRNQATVDAEVNGWLRFMGKA